MKKKILALIVLFAVILGVASCGEKKVKVIPAKEVINIDYQWRDFSYSIPEEWEETIVDGNVKN